ncbi:MAG: hypothetical protein AAB152_16225 [Candidatus Coatesbacteria bacterium]
MPDRDVKTVRDLIYYQYAKIIARSAFKAADGKEAKRANYGFFADTHPGEKKPYDLLPPLLEKKCLKTVFNCHVCAGTLDRPDLNGDGTISVADIDAVLIPG